MDAVFLARLQFALTVGFHYLYPPLSIGLGLVLVLMEGLYLKTRNPAHLQMTKFWVKLFALIFTFGAATGIVLEFEFGTNWATYSRFVGDVFGSPLAAEGILSFFLESSFLAILIFGWNRIGPKMHFFSTLMVAIGATMSAFWIVVANSWMQTPAGYRIVQWGTATRAEITGFWQMVFNPSALDRFIHVVLGCWQAGGWLVVSIAAFYLLKKRHLEFAKTSLKIGLIVGFTAALGQLVSGHTSAIGVSRYQPVKLAALEGHYAENEAAPLNLFGWVDEKNERLIYSVGIPHFLSFLVSGKWDQPVKGLKSFPKEDRPPVNFVFQSYHIMIMIGFGLIGLGFLGCYFWWRGTLFETRWFLWLLLPAFLGPQMANQTGWITAEVGRQPWIVYGLLRTSDAISKTVSSSEILISLALFSAVYFLLFLLFISVVFYKIKAGPETVTINP